MNKMSWYKVIFLLFTAVLWTQCQKHGVQMRLTQKGMSYTVDVGIKIMQKDLREKVINEKGKSGSTEYSISNLRISKAVFASHKLFPVSGTGMRGVISDISINAAGRLWYKYKKGWFHFSDTVNIDMKTKNIYFDMTVQLGADTNGRPAISVKYCKAGVGDISLHFSGGGAWIYNLFSGLIEKKMKESLSNMLCKVAIKEINTRARSELATFPVVKKLDSWAEIDYRLTSPPVFTSNYMDAFLKGEFKSRKDPVESQLRLPTFNTSSDHNKMVYFWITDYTANTAGEVYHKTGCLSATFAAWDSKMPSNLKAMLNTKTFALLFPNLSKKYPNEPMALDVYSYKAPKVQIEENKLTLHLYAYTTFKAKDVTSKVHDLFAMKFDISAALTVSVKGDNVSGEITSLNYDGKVDKSYIGPIVIPLNNKLVKTILERTIISKTNPLLEKGFPLPKIQEITLQNFDIKLEKDVIRIGSDVRYVKDKH